MTLKRMLTGCPFPDGLLTLHYKEKNEKTVQMPCFDSLLQGIFLFCNLLVEAKMMNIDFIGR